MSRMNDTPLVETPAEIAPKTAQSTRGGGKSKGANKGWGFLRRPTSSQGRVILPVEPYPSCCSKNAATLPEELLCNVPLELKSLGLTDSEWVPAAKELDRILQESTTPVCWMVCAWMFIFPGFYMIRRMNNMQRRVLAWQEEFNSRVLAKHGMYLKTCKAWMQADKYREEISWIVVATTPDQVEALKEEAHIWRVWGSTIHADTGGCCSGASCCGVQQVI